HVAHGDARVLQARAVTEHVGVGQKDALFDRGQGGPEATPIGFAAALRVRVEEAVSVVVDVGDRERGRAGIDGAARAYVAGPAATRAAQAGSHRGPSARPPPASPALPRPRARP